MRVLKREQHNMIRLESFDLKTSKDVHNVILFACFGEDTLKEDLDGRTWNFIFYAAVEPIDSSDRNRKTARSKPTNYLLKPSLIKVRFESNLQGCELYWMCS